MKSFELNRLQGGLVQSAFYLGYFLLAMPAAFIMDRYSYKTGLIAGLLLFATGCFLFYPATHVGQYWVFLLALFVIACGLAFLETGANSFIAVMGDASTSERRLNFAQAFNPLGAMGGAIIGTLFIFSGTEHSAEQIEAMKAAGTYKDYLQNEMMRVAPPYLFIGLVLLVWVVLLWRTKFPSDKKLETDTETKKHGSVKVLFKYPHFVKGVLAQFFYVGAQVGTWSFLIQYIKDFMQKPEKEAGMYLTASLLVFGIGRFVSVVLMKHIQPSRLMGLFSIINIVLVMNSILNPGVMGGYTLVLSSFFMSLMFPTIFSLGIKGLGPNTKLGGSMIIMSIIGGAIWTPLMGLVADQTGSMAMAMVVPMVSYIYIVYYSFLGSKPAGPLYEGHHESAVTSH